MDNLKKRKTASGADAYDGLHGSTQTFGAIGLLEAVSGEIILRGRNGQRDVIFPLDKAIDKYNDTMQTVWQYARYGIKGWDTLKDIADDFKMRILEAVKQRHKLNYEISDKANDFVQKNQQ